MKFRVLNIMEVEGNNHVKHIKQTYVSENQRGYPESDKFKDAISRRQNSCRISACETV